MSVALYRALALVAAASAVARADEPPPDPAVEDAAQANLASTSWRDNIVVTLAAGPSLTLGFGIDDAVGRGGSAMLRIAKVATPRWMVTLEGQTYALLHSFSGKVYTNSEFVAQLGAQYYARPKLWVRIASGVGIYRGEMVALEGGGRGDQELVGLAGTFGVGIDIKRWGRVVLGIEGATTTLLTRDGLLVSSGLLLALSID